MEKASSSPDQPRDAAAGAARQGGLHVPEGQARFFSISIFRARLIGFFPFGKAPLSELKSDRQYVSRFHSRSIRSNPLKDISRRLFLLTSVRSH